MVSQSSRKLFAPRFLLLIAICLVPLLAYVQTRQKPIIVSYVTANTKPLPDLQYITHINYAFGTVNRTFDGVNISNEDRLRQVVALKKQDLELKVLLSIGGWGAGRFSEMAADERLRMRFAKDCKRIVDEFQIDGIDIDWEYPSSAEAGISASDDDIDNFTLLMRDIRQEIGKQKLLTLATIADGKYIDFRGIDSYIDFVNVMMYDVTKPPRHHSALYSSPLAGRITAVEAIDAHLEAGVPLNKLVLGVPFYGRGDKVKVSDFVLFRDLDKYSHFEKRWDDEAKVPYLVDNDGVLVLTYENAESIRLKGAYARQRGLLGAMYWEFYGDNDDLELSKALHEALYGN